jgi:RimJ/RimL family protein N-acetyltransferase
MIHFNVIKGGVMNIQFEKATLAHKDIIFEWLNESHMQEFWDNSQEHKDDIINFINGRIEPSHYFDGIFTYWIGLTDNEPFCFILSAPVVLGDNDHQIWKEHLSTTGTTISIDFGIGNKAFLGKGLAAQSLCAFTEFFKSQIDPKADTFFIDPDENNPRAKHVYEKAGFKMVGDFKTEGKYWKFSGDKTCLMVKKL